MSKSSECRKCGEPLFFDRESGRFVCPHHHETDIDTEVDEVEYTYGGMEAYD